MWLLKNLQPDHNTISNFRRDNSKAIKKIFKATVCITKHFELIGGKLLAGDSTKMRAQNSKKNNFKKRHRSFGNFLSNMIAGLIAYSFLPKKLQIRFQTQNTNQICLF